MDENRRKPFEGREVPFVVVHTSILGTAHATPRKICPPLFAFQEHFPADTTDITGMSGLNMLDSLDTYATQTTTELYYPHHGCHEAVELLHDRHQMSGALLRHQKTNTRYLISKYTALPNPA